MLSGVHKLSAPGSSSEHDDERAKECRDKGRVQGGVSLGPQDGHITWGGQNRYAQEDTSAHP